MASDNCAVGPNGNLLDASQIVWFNDPDDDKPMAPATSSTAQPQVSVMMLDSYITKVPAVHQSTRAPHPSTKAINPNNIMALKRKPSNPAPNKPSCCPHHASLDHKVDKATEPDLTNSEDNNPVDPDAVYEETKALSDADCDVSVCYS